MARTTPGEDVREAAEQVVWEGMLANKDAHTIVGRLVERDLLTSVPPPGAELTLEERDVLVRAVNEAIRSWPEEKIGTAYDALYSARSKLSALSTPAPEETNGDER